MKLYPGDIQKTHGPFNPKAIVVLVDELGEVMSSSNFKLVNSIQNNLSSIARLGRAGATHLCLATQRPSSNTISSELKTNINAGILLGHFDAGASSLIFDEDISHMAKPEIKGRGYLKTGSIVEFQSYWTDKKTDFVKKDLSKVPQLDPNRANAKVKITETKNDINDHIDKTKDDYEGSINHRRSMSKNSEYSSHSNDRRYDDRRSHNDISRNGDSKRPTKEEIETRIRNAHHPSKETLTKDITDETPRRNRIRSTTERDANGKQPVGVGVVDQDRNDILHALAVSRKEAGKELAVPTEMTLPEESELTKTQNNNDKNENEKRINSIKLSGNVNTCTNKNNISPGRIKLGGSNAIKNLGVVNVDSKTHSESTNSSIDKVDKPVSPAKIIKDEPKDDELPFEILQ